MTVHRAHPPIRVRTARRGLPVALACVMLMAGCTSQVVGPPLHAGPAASPGPGSGPGVPPEAGTCRRLADAERGAASSDAPVVGCRTPHTGHTFHVGRFPADADDVDRDLAARTCARGMLRALDLRPRQLEGTVLDHVWFRPTREQWEAGARWFRCDLVAPDPSGDGLLELPPGVPPYRPRVPDAVARCLRQLAGAREARIVTCDRPHEYRWVGSVEAVVTRRPGETRARTLAQRRCAPLVGEGRFWFTWPTPAAWAAGDRTVNCYRAG